MASSCAVRLRTLEDVRDWVRDQGSDSRSIPHGYLEERGAFPERLPWLILTGRLLHDFHHTVDEWAQWAMGVVETWPDDLRDAQPDWQALEGMARLADSLSRDGSAARGPAVRS